MLRLRYLWLLAAFFGFTWPALAQSKPAPELSAARDICVLIPAGLAAKWPLYGFSLDEDGRPSYNIRRRFRGADGLQTVATSATRTKPEVPRTRSIDAMSEKQEPVTLDKEVFIPAFERRVRYYLQSHGGGADNDYYATEPLAWSDGHGGTLWIVIQAEVDRTPPEKLLASVKWVEPGKVARWKTRG